MSHERWSELAEIQALGALDGEDLRLWKEHAGQGCVECQKKIDEIHGLLSERPLVAPLAPPVSVKSALMARLDSPLRPARRTPLAPVFAVAVMAAALGLWFGLPSLIEQRAAPPTAKPAAAPIPPPEAALPAPAAQAPADRLHSAQIKAILSDPATRVIEFKDPQTGEKKSAKLHWNPKACGGCLIVEGLSKTDLDKVYEFWAIDSNGPLAAGTFTVDEEGRGHLDISGLDITRNYDKFAVTIEPRGGAAAPTGPMKLLSL
jgi:hypothetical protein